MTGYLCPGLSKRAVTNNTVLLWVSTFDVSLMLQVNLPLVNTVHPGNKFVMGVKIKATSKLKLNESPVCHLLIINLKTVL